MAHNSHNASIDETAKPWSSEFKRGTNTHGQTWEDIFGTPEHPMLPKEIPPHEWEPDFSEGEPSPDSKVCGLCGREHEA